MIFLAFETKHVNAHLWDLLPNITEALPGVLEKRETRAFISEEQGNKDQNLRGTGEQRQYWGTGNIRKFYDFWGTRAFISGEQGNKYPLGGPHHWLATSASACRIKTVSKRIMKSHPKILFPPNMSSPSDIITIYHDYTHSSFPHEIMCVIG